MSTADRSILLPRGVMKELQSPPEMTTQSSITREIIAGRSTTASFTWWLFRVLKPIFMPKPVHLRGPQIFPFPPPISATCVAEEWTYEGWKMTSIFPKNKPKDTLSRAVIYFHGGAFNYPVNAGHWKLSSTLSEELDAEVVLVPTPLAPENTADEVIPALVRVYVEFVKRAEGREIILAGDSSGGNLALVVTLSVALCGLSLPHQLILISPWLDLACTNPKMEVIAPNDPMINLQRIQDKAALWIQGNSRLPAPDFHRSLEDPLISPIHADLGPLAASGMQIVLVSGTWDVLHADITLFIEKAERAGLTVHYIEGPGLTHVFPLYAHILPEGRVAITKVVNAVKAYYGGERWANHSSGSDGGEST